MFREGFKQRKQELAIRLYEMFNEKVFENRLPECMEITWNDRMTKTAGFCQNRKKITKSTGVVEYTARIELSSKVIDSAGRLCDTLIHELCHAATFIINQAKEAHGPIWQSW